MDFIATAYKQDMNRLTTSPNCFFVYWQCPLTIALEDFTWLTKYILHFKVTTSVYMIDIK